jgi:hypothetical protein
MFLQQPDGHWMERMETTKKRRTMKITKSTYQNQWYLLSIYIMFSLHLSVLASQWKRKETLAVY